MNGGLSSALFLVLWATVLIRLPTIARGPQERAVWATVLCLALVKTASSPTGSGVLERVIPQADVVPHLFAAVSAAFLLRFVALVSGRVVRWQPALTAAVLVALLLSIDTPAYWVILNCYLGAVLTAAGVIFWHPARAAGSGPLRLGLRAMAVGVWIIALYAVVKTVLVLADALGAPVSFTPIEPAANAVRTAGMLLAVVGAAVPASGKARTIVRAYRSLWALRPLWTVMRRTFPDVILFSRRRALVELAGFEEVRLRLYRRVIEIRDGMLALRGYLPPTAHDEAERFPGVDSAALVEACAIALALDRRSRGEAPSGSDGRWTQAGDDLAGEVAWLSAVSVASRRPEPARFAASH